MARGRAGLQAQEKNFRFRLLTLTGSGHSGSTDSGSLLVRIHFVSSALTLEQDVVEPPLQPVRVF